MQAVFVELPAFNRHRDRYLDDAGLRALQDTLMKHPEAGDEIRSTGGLRKLRLPDPRRAKGKRGGLRLIYYWWLGGQQFWLFTLYGKDEVADLTPEQCRTLKRMVKQELKARSEI